MLFETELWFTISKTVLTTVMTLFLMCVFTDFKYSKKRVCLFFFLYLIYVGLSTFFILQILPWKVFLKLFVFTITIPAIGLICFMAKHNAMQTVFNYMTQINVALLVSVSATLLNTAFHGNKISDLLLRFFLFGAVILLEYRFLRKPFLKFADTLYNRWAAMAVVPVVFCALILLCGLFPTHFLENTWGAVQIYAITATMVIVYVVIFQSLLKSFRLTQIKKENDILTVQVDALKNQLEALRTSEEQIALQRHDMRHYIRSIGTLLQGREIDAALRLIDKTEDQFSLTRVPHYCENATMNAILAFYLEKARAGGIAVKTHLDIPTKLPVNELELSAVFANAIENAVNACNKLKDGTEKQIQITCVNQQAFVFEIANTYDGKVEFNKKDMPVSKEKGHGTGTQSIAAFVRKNNAILSYQTTPSLFKIRILINREQNS